jgi:hypothetical protein
MPFGTLLTLIAAVPMVALIVWTLTFGLRIKPDRARRSEDWSRITGRGQDTGGAPGRTSHPG